MNDKPLRWRQRVDIADVTGVTRLVSATGMFSDEEVTIAAELVAETLARGAAAGYDFVFVETTDATPELVAYACFGRIPLTASSYDLYWIAVSPSRQGTGLGARTLRAAEDAARAAGATRMFVDTAGRAQYAGTRAFYASMGYTPEATLRDFYAPGDDKVVYARSL